MNSFLIAATVLIAALAPLLAVASLRPPIDGLVALEAAGAILTLILLCLSVGLGQSTFFTVPIIAAVTCWIGCLVFARFLGGWT